MKTTFPSLASLLLACWGAALVAQGPAVPDQRAAAQETLRAASSALERYETVVAKVRQRAEILGKQVTGSGAYVQGPARYNLVRLELSMQVEDHPCTLLQICDGKQLWTHRDQWGETKLSLLDAQKVLAALQKNETARQQAALSGLALGGLPRVLRELLRMFEFTELQPAQLGTLPVRVLRGQWRADRLKALLPEQAEAMAAGQPADLAKLPAHAPDEVLLYLGRSDLFPYRLECRRRAGRDAASPQPLFAVEFYEVRVNSAVDPLQFVYTPGTARYTDETDAYLAGHGL